MENRYCAPTNQITAFGVVKKRRPSVQVAFVGEALVKLLYPIDRTEKNASSPTLCTAYLARTQPKSCTRNTMLYLHF